VIAVANWLWSWQPYCSVCVVMVLVRGIGPGEEASPLPRLSLKNFITIIVIKSFCRHPTPQMF